MSCRDLRHPLCIVSGFQHPLGFFLFAQQPQTPYFSD